MSEPLAPEDPPTPEPAPLPEPAEDEPAADEEPAESNADQLHGKFSPALEEVLTGILDRLDKGGL